MTPADARESAGLALDAAAKKLRISPRYLRTKEIHGDWPWSLANRAAKLYQCRLKTFLYCRGSRRAAVTKTRQGCSPAALANRYEHPYEAGNSL
jgi:hypothetical protein